MEQCSASRIAVALLVLFGAVNLVRGSIHLFSADGGLIDIAGLDLSAARETILFFIGAVGVCIGAIVADLLIDLGQYGPHIAATYAAAWIGGMTDMVAMAEITDLPPDVFAVAVSASAPVSIIGSSRTPVATGVRSCTLCR